MYPWLTGELLLLPYYFVPQDFDACSGQVLAIGDGVLFELIGNQFGGDGTSHFALPDLREHEPVKHVKYCIATSGTPPV